MLDRHGETVRLRIEALSRDITALASFRPFSAGRINAGTVDLRGTVALLPGVHEIDGETQAGVSDCLLLSNDIAASDAVLIPPLAAALAAWEKLQLELGEAAVWSAGAPLSELMGQVALWRGAGLAIALGDARSTASPLAVEHIERVDWTDQESAIARFEKLIDGKPGFAAVELSGRADVIDIFLEAIPRFGRLLLAGPAGDPVTIDFYKNVHRKGIVLSTTTLEPAMVFDPVAGVDLRAQIRRALAILRNPQMASHCRSLLGAGQSAVRVSVAR
jgi:hypothetical protein